MDASETDTESPVLVRRYEESDLEAVAGLMGDLGYPTTPSRMAVRMSALSAHHAQATYVAVLEGAVAGLIGMKLTSCYEEDGLTVHISALVTKKEYEGRGVGQALIRRAEQWALANGAESLNLTSGIKPERERAHRFYQTSGFQVTGYRFVKKLDGDSSPPER